MQDVIRFSMDDRGGNRVPIGNLSSALIHGGRSVRNFFDGDLLVWGKPANRGGALWPSTVPR